MEFEIERFYKKPGLTKIRLQIIREKVKSIVPNLGPAEARVSITSEICFNVEVQSGKLGENERKDLQWILAHSFEEGNLSPRSWIYADESEATSKSLLIEIGPRLNFSTAWSTNAVSVCHAVGLQCVKRIEASIRYLIKTSGEYDISSQLTKQEKELIVKSLHDPMTECQYHKPLESFDINVSPEPCYEIDVMGDGKIALEKANASLGLSFDDRDLEFYLQLFKDQLQRNPTSVELFDLAQSNSEHSRHWFFRGNMVIDDKQMPASLMKMVMNTQKSSNPNSIIKFCDNSR